MSQRSIERDHEERSSVLGDNMQEQRQGLPDVNQRVPPPRNQRFVNEYARPRAARHEDYEDELDREYLGGGNQYGQLARRRDLGRTMRGVCAPYIDEAPWCIRLDEDAEDIEIKGGVIHHLPKFGGMPDENPLRHLKEFHGVCMSMKSASVPENIFKLKAFPFSLVSQAKSWLMSLPSGSIISWDQMQRKFMDKYYSHSKAAQIRKELSMLRQGRGETLFDYLERFRQLEESCPNHGIPQRMLLEYFMDGMILMERRILDASAQGTILDMYPEEIWELIERVAESTRQNVNELNKQVSQIASAIYEKREDKGKLPSQTIPNPRQNVSVIVIKDEEEMKAEGKKKEKNLDSTSVNWADVSPIKSRTPQQLQNEETSVEDNQETCAEFSVSNFQILISNPLAPSPFPMQVTERHEAINNVMFP
ncbi:unnamed protein product [Rhodiola kirilowii]